MIPPALLQGKIPRKLIELAGLEVILQCMGAAAVCAAMRTPQNNSDAARVKSTRAEIAVVSAFAAAVLAAAVYSARGGARRWVSLTAAMWYFTYHIAKQAVASAKGRGVIYKLHGADTGGIAAAYYEKYDAIQAIQMLPRAWLLFVLVQADLRQMRFGH